MRASTGRIIRKKEIRSSAINILIFSLTKTKILIALDLISFYFIKIYLKTSNENLRDHKRAFAMKLYTQNSLQIKLRLGKRRWRGAWS